MSYERTVDNAVEALNPGHSLQLQMWRSQDIGRAIADAVSAEREACAKMLEERAAECEGFSDQGSDFYRGAYNNLKAMAAQIRARGMDAVEKEVKKGKK